MRGNTRHEVDRIYERLARLWSRTKDRGTQEEEGGEGGGAKKIHKCFYEKGIFLVSGSDTAILRNTVWKLATQ